MMMQIEICASSYTALNLAAQYKVSRVELCQNLSCGGLTPSLALVRRALDLGLNTHVLIRPRAGDFCYSESECQQIIDEVNLYKQLGIQGIVIGALTKERRLLYPLISRIRKISNSLELTFHKGFDDIVDWKSAMDTLIDLKFDRILTSGQSVNVFEGIEMLKAFNSYADGRIQILPGGGVVVDNIQSILNGLQPEGIHFSGTKNDVKNNSEYFASDVLSVDSNKLHDMVELTKSYRAI
jgi:copper homeostasis protein